MSGNDKDHTVTNSQDKSYKQEVSITPKDRVDSGYYSEDIDPHALGSLGIAFTKSPEKMTDDSGKGDNDRSGLKE
ncbi:hypothetical protein MMC22_006653 [Lobaria immixta]|nr:hypothetical protein [Lobaria immixta]